MGHSLLQLMLWLILCNCLELNILGLKYLDYSFKRFTIYVRSYSLGLAWEIMPYSSWYWFSTIASCPSRANTTCVFRFSQLHSKTNLSRFLISMLLIQSCSTSISAQSLLVSSSRWVIDQKQLDGNTSQRYIEYFHFPFLLACNWSSVFDGF